MKLSNPIGRSTMTPQMLREILRYNPENGHLFWRERPSEMFSCHRIWKSWNSNYANRRALYTKDKDGYRVGTIFSLKFKSHRVAWAIYYGDWPNQQIDHINGVKSDNRIANLRDVSQQTNRMNSRLSQKNTSGHVGVSGKRGKWNASVQIHKNVIHLGRFKLKREAIVAARAARKALGFGEVHGK